jgi:8-oxo-dGTP pyrophosphatase MutT (NUDIX family)
LGEDDLMALKRECLEEIGCEIRVIQGIGQIKEYRGDLDQDSFCYLARTIGEKGEPTFTDKEKKEGFECLWVPFSKALSLVSGAETTDDGRFIKNRDAIFLFESRKCVATITKK